MAARTRFAPSPTGRLHLGGLRTAAMNYLMSRTTPGGRMILRIDDTDASRTVPGAVESIIDDLKWSGINYDEGPDKPNASGPFLQSLRVGLYLRFARELIDKGAAYKCTCSPERLEARRVEAIKKRLPYVYDGRCRDKPSHETAIGTGVLRLRLNRKTAEKGQSDPILLKSDQLPTYHLASPVDDHLMGITHVIRGVEWLTSMPIYDQIFSVLGWKQPNVTHLPILRDERGKKLSKRSDDESYDYSVKGFRESGYLPSALMQYLVLLGTSSFSFEKPLFLNDLSKDFRLDVGCLSPNTVNLGHLKVLQKLHFIDLAQKYDNYVIEELRSAVKPLEVLMTDKNRLTSDKYLISVLNLLSSRFYDIPTILKMAPYFWVDPEPPNSIDKDTVDIARKFIDTVNTDVIATGLLEEISTCNSVILKTSEELEKNGISRTKVINVLRQLLTGTTIGAKLGETFAVLGLQSIVLPRLVKILNFASSPKKIIVTDFPCAK